MSYSSGRDDTLGWAEEGVIPSPLRRWSGGVLWKDKFACFCRIVVYLLPRVSKGGIYPAPTRDSAVRRHVGAAYMPPFVRSRRFVIGSEGNGRVEESMGRAGALGRPVSREVEWEGALDPRRPSNYSPYMNEPEVVTSRSPQDSDPAAGR